MHLLSKRFLLPAALLAFSTDAALAGSSPKRIRILCDQATELDMCEGLRDAIALRFPDQDVDLSKDSSASNVTVLRLMADQRRVDTVSGYLVWTTAEGKTGQSRAMEMSVIDAPLTSAMRREFGANLAALFSPQH